MIHYANVNGQDHPFKIGMREHQIMYRNAIKLDADFNELKGMSEKDVQSKLKVDVNEVINRVVTDFDTFLTMFALASKKGCRHHNKEAKESVEPLSELELEDAIDENPDLYSELMDIFMKSNLPDEKKGGKKKPQKP